MAQVIYTQNALANLERAFAFLTEHDPAAAVAAAAAIRHQREMDYPDYRAPHK